MHSKNAPTTIPLATYGAQAAAIKALALGPDNISRVGLKLPETFPFEKWHELGGRLLTLETSVRWWLGDWLLHGEKHYGEKYKEAGEAGFHYKAAADAKWVAKRFEFSRRHEKLSWTHHREVAGLGPAKADRLLAQAEREGWSIKTLRAAVASKCKQDSKIPNPPSKP